MTPLARLEGPADEWDAIAVSYTSGHHRRPEGRGHPPPRRLPQRGVQRGRLDHAALPEVPVDAADVPLQRLVLHLDDRHARRHPHLPAQGRGPGHPRRHPRHGADHYCAAPIVHSLIYNAPDALRAGITHAVRGMVAGAAPPAAMIEGMARIGFDITHVYGLTETYGPAAVAVKRPAWAQENLSEQTRLNGRQGARYPMQEGMTVLDAGTMAEVPADGHTMGEVMFRGNIVMKGYLKNPASTRRRPSRAAGSTPATSAVHRARPLRQAQGPQQGHHHQRRREHQFSMEVEDALYRHPAMVPPAPSSPGPTTKWGETPVAFVELRPGATARAPKN
jgi:fatty-acyl-CoA synthase